MEDTFDGTYTCKRCKKDKIFVANNPTLSDYYKRPDNGRPRGTCKECDLLYASLKDQTRGPRVSKSTYWSMCRAQKGKCLICGEKKSKLKVDTFDRKIRGLLCLACRRGVKAFNNNVNLLLVAMGYIRDNK